MQDRTNLTPELLEKMRGELIELLSKYVEMDKDALELNFEQEGNQMALMLSIPVLRAKDEDEIEDATEKSEETEDAAEESSEEEQTENSGENSGAESEENSECQEESDEKESNTNSKNKSK